MGIVVFFYVFRIVFIGLGCFFCGSRFFLGLVESFLGGYGEVRRYGRV